MATKFITVSIEIMHDKNLSPNQKFILAEIEQLSHLEKGCVASNRHFSELIGITTMGVSKAINNLATKGYIIIDNAQTKRNFGRVITINSGKSPINCGKSDINSGLESKENKTINKTKNNKNTKKDLTQEYIEENKIEDSRLIEIIKDFVAWRITLKKPIKTTGPIKAYLKALKELQELGYKANDCIQKMKESEWQTIKVDYIHKNVKQNTNSNTSGLQASLNVINEMYGKEETFDCGQSMEVIEGEISQ